MPGIGAPGGGGGMIGGGGGGGGGACAITILAVMKRASIPVINNTWMALHILFISLFITE